MDIIDLYTWTRLYGGELKKCRIDNIYHSRFYWLLKLRCPNRGKTLLKIEPGVRIHISSVEPREKEIDKLTAFMRKHIRNGIVENISLMGWERIVRIDVTSRSRGYHLYLEIIPRGFLVITDRDDKILYANRFASLRDRSVRIGQTYTPPPGRVNLLSLTPSDLIERLRIGKDLVRGIVKGWGLPGYLAEEIIYRAGLYRYKNARIEEMPRDDLRILVDKYKELLEEASSNTGYVVLQDDKPVYASPYEPRLFMDKYDVEVKKFDSFNNALDYYFSEYEKNRYLEEVMARRMEELNGLRRSLKEVEELLEKYIGEKENLEKILNTIYSNHKKIEKVLECSMRIHRRYGWSKIPELCSVDGIDERKGYIYIVIDDVRIPLSIRMDLWSNVNEIRKKIGGLKRKIERAHEKIDELKSRIRELEERITYDKLSVERGIRPRLWFEKYHWMITRNGFLVIGGRDAGQNETIVRRYLEPEDIFLHADIHGAPATVIKTYGKVPGEEDIRDAAVIAACYSRAWREGLGYIDVFWVMGEQVSKKPPSGEYLAKGAFMIYGRKNYLSVELELALGVEEVCDDIYGLYQRIIVGPIDLVKSRSIIYVVITPGDESARSISSKIYSIFKKKLREKHVLSVRPEDIEYRIPGRSMIKGIGYGDRYGEEICID